VQQFDKLERGGVPDFSKPTSTASPTSSSGSRLPLASSGMASKQKPGTMAGLSKNSEGGLA
jgi:hypothetical protein